MNEPPFDPADLMDEITAPDGDDEDWHIPGLPDALAKACVDSFEYMLGLRTGQVIQFGSAEVSQDHKWVHLAPSDFERDDPFMTGIEAPFERGIDVRVEDIVWVADAPYGS